MPELGHPVVESREGGAVSYVIHQHDALHIRVELAAYLQYVNEIEQEYHN